MGRVIALWSGGKDSCLAYHEALSSGSEVTHLLNFVSQDRPIPHGFRPEPIALQAQAIGVPLVQAKISWETYEREFKTMAK